MQLRFVIFRRHGASAASVSYVGIGRRLGMLEVELEVSLLFRLIVIRASILIIRLLCPLGWRALLQSRIKQSH